MRIIIIICVILLSVNSANSQTCSINEWIRLNYDAEAKRLALREITADSTHPYFHSIDIPDFLTEKYLSILSAVYEIQDSGTDSIFNLFRIPVDIDFDPYYIHLYLDTNETWVKNLILDAEVPTGIHNLDSIMLQYHLRLSVSIIQDILITFRIRTDSILNPYALVNYLTSNVPGIIHGQPGAVFRAGSYSFNTTVNSTNVSTHEVYFSNCELMMYCFSWEYSVQQNPCSAELISQGSFVETNVNEFEKGKFQFFPNPANTTIVIKLTSSIPKVKNIRISDISGKIFSNESINNHDSHSIDVSKLNSGIYLLILELNNGECYVEKFVKSSF